MTGSTANTPTPIPHEIIESKIYLVRNKKVMIDRDLAALYNVPTKRLNEQVKRNKERFPQEFMFRLTTQEMRELVAKCDRFAMLKHSSVPPYAFTEYGALMIAQVIKSTVAVHVSIEIVKAFVKLREYLANNADLKHKVEAMEKKYDHQFKVVFETIKKMLTPDDPPQKKGTIGFHTS